MLSFTQLPSVSMTKDMCQAEAQAKEPLTFGKVLRLVLAIPLLVTLLFLTISGFLPGLFLATVLFLPALAPFFGVCLMMCCAPEPGRQSPYTRNQR